MGANDEHPYGNYGILAEANRAKARGDPRDADQGLLDGGRDRDELPRDSVNPDRVRAQEIIESLEQDIGEELGHAKQFANPIKELYGVVSGSREFSAEQSYLQPPEHQTDIMVIAILRDEERHRRLFEGYLREYRAEGVT